MEDDPGQQGDEAEFEDAFDRRWSAVLNAEADLLREKSELLLATGAASIELRAGVVTAQFRAPRWRGRPKLNIEAISFGDSSRRASAHGPMAAKYGDRAALIKEVTLSLAIHLAWLEEDE